MITLGKKGDLAARRQAAAYLMTDAAVTKLFDTVAPRFGDRKGGYLRIVRTGWRKGDGADTAFIELLGSEQGLDEKRQKRAEVRAKRAEETRKAMEDAEPQGGPLAEPGEGCRQSVDVRSKNTRIKRHVHLLAATGIFRSQSAGIHEKYYFDLSGIGRLSLRPE